MSHVRAYAGRGAQIGCCVAVACALICAASCRQSADSRIAAHGFTHIVTRATAYYTDGPQQARPPDGTLEDGTRVRLLQANGSYALIAEPARAYVSTSDLKPLE